MNHTSFVFFVAPGKLFFTSYERDASGNDYAVFRSHMNRTGRFTSPDPIAGSITDPQSLNRYAYVRNDPVNLTDPLGLEPTFLDPTLYDMTDYAGNCVLNGISVPCSLAFASQESIQGIYLSPGWTLDLNADLSLERYLARSLAWSWDTTVDRILGFSRLIWPFGGDGNEGGSDADNQTPQKIKDLVNAALNHPRLSKCLNEFFGPGIILTNENLPYVDATKNLPGVGQTDSRQVPDTGRGTVQIDRGIYTSLSANDPYLVSTYLHEVANALAIQRFTHVFPRWQRPRLGPLGRPPSREQRRSFDPDIGRQFEECLYRKD